MSHRDVYPTGGLVYQGVRIPAAAVRNGEIEIDRIINGHISKVTRCRQAAILMAGLKRVGKHKQHIACQPRDVFIIIAKQLWATRGDERWAGPLNFRLEWSGHGIMRVHAPQLMFEYVEMPHYGEFTIRYCNETYRFSTTCANRLESLPPLPMQLFLREQMCKAIDIAEFLLPTGVYHLAKTEWARMLSNVRLA